ncbi:MAG TPA: YqgE/AlgH family protein [Alphaproteobacteria bacterium]|nr:YqgE/AlgH family protein [Alphaproteobacteria bacterium]HNS44767.1 YqgE/AlgH family protein [Alphaproteobacteria bacterium]
MKSLRAALNWQTLLAVFFILLPTLLGFYHGDRGRLIAMVSAASDPNFSKTVLFMFDQNWYRSRALVLNRPYPDRSSLPSYLRKGEVPIYWGGPVEDRDSVFILGIQDGKLTKVISFDEAVKIQPDILAQVAKRPDCYRVFVGYAGWGLAQFQLEKELQIWRVTDFAPFVFDPALSFEEIWQKALSLSSDKKKPKIRDRQKT